MAGAARVSSSGVTRWATFDCYGTLIDWNGGIRGELARLWPDADADDLLRRYHQLEPEIEAAEPTLSYREVMQRALAELGHVPAGGRARQILAGMAAVPRGAAAAPGARDRGWRLAILSNTDRDFIEASKLQLGVDFDETVVASEIGSYKPARRHWEEFDARTNAERARHVHVAASVLHDIEPANELQLATVWINRLGEISDTRPTRELPDLEALPETLDELVAPGYTVRAATDADVQPVTALARAAEEAVRGRSDVGAADVRDWWKLVQLTTDSWLVEREGELRAGGVLIVLREVPDFWGLVRPDEVGRGLGSALLTLGENRARERGATKLHAGTFAESASQRSSSSAAGIATSGATRCTSGSRSRPFPRGRTACESSAFTPRTRVRSTTP